MQEHLHKVGTQQVEEDPILGLFDVGRHFDGDEYEDQGLGVGERRVLQRVRMQRIVPCISGTGQ